MEDGGSGKRGPDPDNGGSSGDQEYQVETGEDYVQVTFPGGDRIVADDEGGIMSDQGDE